jgi:hypothetical protein
MRSHRQTAFTALTHPPSTVVPGWLVRLTRESAVETNGLTVCTSAHPHIFSHSLLAAVSRARLQIPRSSDPDTEASQFRSGLEDTQKDMEPLSQIQTKRRHGSRWRCPSCLCHASSRPPGRRFQIQTAGAAQKQEQREEGLAETRSHTQAVQANGPVSCCKGWDLASRDTAGSSAQTHHSAVVQPGDHSWQTGQSGSLLAVSTVLLLFLYLPSLAVWQFWPKCLQTVLRLPTCPASSFLLAPACTACKASTYPHILCPEAFAPRLSPSTSTTADDDCPDQSIVFHSSTRDQ